MAQIVLGMAFSLLAATAAGEGTKPLTGRVVDEQGGALTGAKITAFAIVSDGWQGGRKQELASVTTGSDGRFGFEAKVMEKCHAVMATKAGKCVDAAYSRSLGVSELVLRLGPAAGLDGLVVSEAGAPVAGVDVKVAFCELSHFPDGMLTTRTDQQGRFLLHALPLAAEVKLDMSAPGYARALAEGPFVPGQRGIRFVLPPEGRLEGTVVARDTGKPLPNIRLGAMSGVRSGMHHANAKTDPTGHFAMSGLSGGKYKIETSGEIVDEELIPPEWIGSTANVEVEAGKLSTNVRIEAVQGGLLEIVPTDAATGRPVQDTGVVIVANQDDLRINRWVSPSKDGVVRARLTAGNYVVTGAISTVYTLDQPKYGPYRVETGKTNRFALTVRTHANRSDRPEAKPAACATGMACDPQDKPVPHAKVQVLSLAGDVTHLVAGEDGRFSVPSTDIGPFACFVWIRHPKQDLEAIAIATLGKPEPDEDKLANSGFVVLRSTPRKVTLRPPLPVSGVVCDPKGLPIPRASVTAQIDGSHLGRSAVFLTTETNHDGRYRLGLPGFTTSSYAITAKASGYNLADAMVDPSELRAGGIKVAKMVLHRADRSVRGVAQDKAGRPVPGTVITAKRISSLRYPGCVVSDAQGSFVLENLDDADTIYLFAQVPGRGWTDAGTTIKPGQKEVVIRVGMYD